MKRITILMLVLAAMLSSARAATFTVNSNTDAVDAAPGDGICAATTGACTLRAAVQETNVLAGADTVTLPAGVYILSLTGIDEDIGATGDLDINDDLTVAGDFTPTTIIDGNATDRVFHIGPGVTVSLSDATIQNGDGPVDGGGVFSAGTLVLDRVTVRANRTSEVISGSHPGAGGGIYNDETGTLTIVNSAIIRNGNANFGNGSAVFNSGNFTASNTTVSGNMANSPYFADPAILNFSPTASTKLNSVTVTANEPSALFNSFGTFTLTNSLVAGNGSTGQSDCHDDSTALTSLGYNLIGAAPCAINSTTGDQIGSPLSPIDPLITPLGDHGGSTETHALFEGSPAIDAGDDAIVGAPLFLDTDQRGASRPQGGGADIGAYETDSILPRPTFSVNKTEDTNDGSCDDLDCSLREAIHAANANGASDIVTVPSGIYTLTSGSQLRIEAGLTLVGAGLDETIIEAATEPGLATSRVLEITQGTVVAISGVTLRHGNSNLDGGGLLNGGSLTLVDSVVEANNTRGNTGGVRNIGALTMMRTSVRRNTASFGSGGLYNTGAAIVTESNIYGNTVGSAFGNRGGGGIYTGGSLTLDRSAVFDNSTSGNGGGIDIRAQQPSITITIRNSTLSGNTASNQGGGIYASGAFLMTLEIESATISDNSAAAGGGIHVQTGDVFVLNTIVADNSSTDCSGLALISEGHNLDSDDTCGLTGAGDQPGVNPMLDALADNGGLTLTHALLLGSPAIDAVPVADCVNVFGNPILVDQRGVFRPLDGDGNGIAFCDIGAYEFEPVSVEIDIQPFDPDNEIRPNSDNPIPVAVLGRNTATGDPIDFDVTQIDPATLRFGPGEAVTITPNPWLDDFDGDGNQDAAFGFRTQASGIVCDDTEATLVGSTFSSEPFSGTDTVMTSDCVTGFCHPLE